MGKSLTLFADLQALTNNNTLLANTESGILNEVQSQAYLTGELSKGKPTSKVVKTGKAIQAFSQFSAGTGSAFYQPADTFTSLIEDVDSTLTFQWRFLHDSYSYTKHEIELNMGGVDAASINAQTIDLLKSKRQAQRVGLFNTIETAWWTAASLATMETATTATRPYSIRCFITEDGQHPSGFTTLAGVASTQTRYRNQTSLYSDVNTGLISAMEAMWTKINFVKPSSMAKYWEDTNLSKFMILTDINGRNTYARLTRESNDRLIESGKDLGSYTGDLPFSGIPVRYVTAIDAIGYASTQPRFFWVNSDYLYPVWNTAAYFAELAAMNSKDQPYVFTVHVDTWYQLVCTSRQRLGIVCPG